VRVRLTHLDGRVIRKYYTFIPFGEYDVNARGALADEAQLPLGGVA
jgi:hypothetical protein